MKYVVILFLLLLAGTRLAYAPFKEKGRFLCAILEYISVVWLLFYIW